MCQGYRGDDYSNLQPKICSAICNSAIVTRTTNLPLTGNGAQSPHTCIWKTDPLSVTITVYDDEHAKEFCKTNVEVSSCNVLLTFEPEFSTSSPTSWRVDRYHNKYRTEILYNPSRNSHMMTTHCKMSPPNCTTESQLHGNVYTPNPRKVTRGLGKLV